MTVTEVVRAQQVHRDVNCSDQKMSWYRGGQEAGTVAVSLMMRSGDRSFYNYDKDLIMCGARDQISGHRIILRTPLPWQGIRHTDNTHTRVSEYFSRVSGPPEMQTCHIIFTSVQWSP